MKISLALLNIISLTIIFNFNLNYVMAEQMEIPIVPNNIYGDPVNRDPLEVAVEAIKANNAMKQAYIDALKAREGQIHIENEFLIRQVAPDPVYNNQKSHTQNFGEAMAAGVAQGFIRHPLGR